MSSTRQRTKPIGVVVIAVALMIAFSGVAAASEPTPENEIGYVQATSMAQGAEDTTLEESDETNNCDEAEEGTNIGVRNPAAVYCMEMGYEYEIEKTNKGERGICVMPNNEECDAWAFYSGECGAEFSYCAKKGWLVASRGEKDSFATKSTTCVLPDGSCKTVSELFNLGETCTVGMKKLDENNRLSDTELNERDIEGENVGLPNHFDWRNKDGENWMTPVKDQGNCGSCWAFSAVGIVEPVYNIAYGNPNLDLDLSEQYLVSDCHTTPWGYQSCCGGGKDFALKYIRDYGITDEACFPYVDATGCTCSDDDTCNTNCNYCDTTSPCSDATCSDRCSDWSSRLKKIDETGNVPNNKEAIKDNLIEKGPLAVSMGIGSEVGGNFVNGIYRCDDDSKTNHAVVIAGYDETEDYWIVRNSWGSSWNGDGYFKVGYGECSIENYVDYVWCRGGGDGKPDLEITDIWHEGSKIYYKIKNIGTEKAGSSRTSLTVDGVYKKYDSVRSLGAGEERTESFRYDWTCTGTSDEIEVCADYKNAVAESEEGNNCRTVTWECPESELPDLVITDVWHEGSKIYYKIKNIGTEEAGSSRTSLTVDGDYKKYDSVRSLGAGEERTESFRYDWTCTGTSDEIEVCADYKNAVAESEEGNNCKTVTWECPESELPDLVITDIWHEGGKIYYKIKNIGTEEAGSSRTSLTVDGDYKKYDSARSLGQGAERTESFRYTWACTEPSDEIKVCADYRNAVAESEEGNNCRTVTWDCEGGNGDKPDLEITDVWHEGSKIYYKIKNIGTEEAGSSRTSLTVDGDYKKYDSVRSLGAGEERTESFRYDWTCTGTSDEIEVCADYKNAVAESEEGNNCRTETWECPEIELPDLVITDIWHEGSKIYYKIKNIGTEEAGSSRTSLTVDGDYKKYDSARSLGQGAERTESFRYTWACTEPSDEIKVCADYKNAVAESEEGNNCKTVTWTCPEIELPDLVITDIWHEGSKIYYKIKNIGTEEAGSSRTSLWVDGDYKKYDSARSLGAGVERTESFRYDWTCTGTSDEIEVCADYNNAVAESEEGNNCRTVTWDCDGGNGDKPDLEITDVWHEGSKMYYKIKNVGTEEAGSSRTGLWVDGVYKKYDSARSLGQGAERTESFRYTWACTEPSDEIKVCADYKNAVAESEEGNNCRTETWECEGGV